MATRFPDYGSYFIYTREAHPGEITPAHATMEDKITAAKRLRDEVGIARPILLDDVTGPVHTAYGLVPNMTWVIARGGLILYKAMWTSAERVSEFLDRRAGAAPSVGADWFYTEQLELRQRDQDLFMKRLERNGPRSVTEFERAAELWKERIRSQRRR